MPRQDVPEDVLMARKKKELPASEFLTNLISMGFLIRVCPPEVIHDVLKGLNKLNERIRLLPATSVVYFIIGMSLWREPPIEEVLRAVFESVAWINYG
jgi:hypothetical protein